MHTMCAQMSIELIASVGMDETDGIYETDRANQWPHCRIRLGDHAIYSIALLSRDGQIRLSLIPTIWLPHGLRRESLLQTPQTLSYAARVSAICAAIGQISETPPAMLASTSKVRLRTSTGASRLPATTISSGRGALSLESPVSLLPQVFPTGWAVRVPKWAFSRVPMASPKFPPGTPDTR